MRGASYKWNGCISKAEEFICLVLSVGTSSGVMENANELANERRGEERMGVEEQRRQSPAHTYLHHLAHVGPRASKRRCFQNRVEIKVGCNEEKKTSCKIWNARRSHLVSGLNTWRFTGIAWRNAKSTIISRFDTLSTKYAIKDFKSDNRFLIISCF